MPPSLARALFASSPAALRSQAPCITSATRSYAEARRPGNGSSLTDKIPDPSHSELGEGRRHVNDVNEKTGHAHDVQSEAALAGKQERAAGTGNSQATTQKGGKHFSDKAKQEHPKAPEPIIGMNEERGAKGH